MSKRTLSRVDAADIEELELAEEKVKKMTEFRKETDDKVACRWCGEGTLDEEMAQRLQFLCPWCGSARITVHYTANGRFGRHGWFGACLCCGARGPIVDTQEMAYDAWENRYGIH